MHHGAIAVYSYAKRLRERTENMGPTEYLHRPMQLQMRQQEAVGTEMETEKVTVTVTAAQAAGAPRRRPHPPQRLHPTNPV